MWTITANWFLAAATTVALILPTVGGATPTTRPASLAVRAIEYGYDLWLIPTAEARAAGVEPMQDKLWATLDAVRSSYFIGGGCTPGEFSEVTESSVTVEGTTLRFLVKAESASGDAVEWNGTIKDGVIEGEFVQAMKGRVVAREEIERQVQRVWEERYAPNIYFMNGIPINQTDIHERFWHEASRLRLRLAGPGRLLRFTFKAPLPARVTVEKVVQRSRRSRRTTEVTKPDSPPPALEKPSPRPSRGRALPR